MPTSERLQRQGVARDADFTATVFAKFTILLAPIAIGFVAIADFVATHQRGRA